jgi:hypothetical protein
VFYERQNLFLLLEQLGLPPVFGEVHIAPHFSFLCCVFGFVCLRSLSCVSLVSLDCHFWIFPVVLISLTFIQLTKYYHMSYLSICFIYYELLFTFCRPLNIILSKFLTILLNLCIA